MEKNDQITVPTHQFLSHRMESLGLSDATVSAELGYSDTKVITAIKAGHMRMPLDKIQALANLLQVSGKALFEAWAREGMPGLLSLLDEVYNPISLTSTELNLIKKLRAEANGESYSPIIISGKSLIALVSA